MLRCIPESAAWHHAVLQTADGLQNGRLILCSRSFRCCQMAEKLLTGASFKAPDWKGPTNAAATNSHPAVAAAAAQADTEMDEVEDAFTEPATVAGTLTAGTAATATASASAPPSAPDAAVMGVDPAVLLPAVLARSPHSSPSARSRGFQQLQHKNPVGSPQQQAPLARRRPMAVIRQPGWQPTVQPQPPAPAPQQSHHLQRQPRCQQPEAAAPQTHVSNLPDDVLQRIFSMLPFRKRCIELRNAHNIAMFCIWCAVLLCTALLRSAAAASGHNGNDPVCYVSRRRLGKVCCHWRALCAGPSQMWHQVGSSLYST